MVSCVANIVYTVASGGLSDTINFGNVYEGILVFALINVNGVISICILNRNKILHATVVFFCLSGRNIDVVRGATRLKLPVPTGLGRILRRLRRQKNGSGRSRWTSSRQGYLLWNESRSRHRKCRNSRRENWRPLTRALY